MYSDLLNNNMHSFIIFTVNDNHAITPVTSQRLGYVPATRGGAILVPWQLAELSPLLLSILQVSGKHQDMRQKTQSCFIRDSDSSPHTKVARVCVLPHLLYLMT
jgi:hypothetical protein